MDSMETRQQKIDRVAHELGAAIRQQVGRKWGAARTAKRKTSSRHVWRFRTGAGEPDRYLSFSHQAMVQGDDPAATLLAQLDAAKWLDRIKEGPETSFRMGRNGHLSGRPAD